jgi:hypothetical protein
MFFFFQKQYVFVQKRLKNIVLSRPTKQNTKISFNFEIYFCVVSIRQFTMLLYLKKKTKNELLFRQSSKIFCKVQYTYFIAELIIRLLFFLLFLNFFCSLKAFNQSDVKLHS